MDKTIRNLWTFQIFRAMVLATAIQLACDPFASASSYGQVSLTAGNSATYAASSVYFTAATSTTDIFQLYGSSTKTIKVLKIFVNHLNATASISASQKWYVIKRSTANSGGTAVTETNVSLDSNNSSATAVAKHYTASPTLGNAVGTVVSVADNALTPGAYYPNGPIVLFDADKFGQPITLRGTSEGVVVNSDGITVVGNTGVTVNFTIIWTEQ